MTVTVNRQTRVHFQPSCNHTGDRLHFDNYHLTAISVKDQKIRRQKPEFEQKIFTIVSQKCLPKALEGQLKAGFAKILWRKNKK